MLGWLPLFTILEEEQRKKQEDSNYKSPYDIDMAEISGRDILIGMLIGLSPFIIAFSIIAIIKWIK